MKNDIKLYLDDIREPKGNNYKVVRSFKEAVEYIQEFGIPSHISFDHDLGCDENGKVFYTGYDFAKYLINCDLDHTVTFPNDFTFNVHSANPIGKQNIENILNSYLKFKV
jgi:hypothetical protein